MDMRKVYAPVLDATDERDTTPVCITIQAWFLMQLLGYATKLADPSFWDGGNDIDVAHAASDAADNVEAMMFDSCGGGGGGVITDIQMVGCEIQVRRGGGAWQSIGSVLDGVSGAGVWVDGSTPTVGVGGCNIVVGVPTSGGTNEYTPDGTNGGSDNICAAVKGLIDHLQAIWEDVLEGMDTWIAGQKAATEVFLGVAKLVTIGLSAVTPLDNVAMLVAQMEVFGIGIRSHTTNTATLFEQRKQLYCLIMKSPNHQLTKTVYEKWVEELYTPTIASLTMLFYRAFLLGHPTQVTDPPFPLNAQRLSWDYISSIYAAHKFREDALCQGFDCDEPDWCHFWDFAEATDWWQITGGGTWVSGQGYKPTLEGGNTELRVSVTFDERKIEQLQIVYDYTGGGGDEHVTFRMKKAGVVVYTDNSGSTTDGSDKSFSRYPNVDADEVEVLIVTGQGSGTATLKSIEVCGDDTDPFVPWCFEMDFTTDDYDEFVSIRNSQWGLWGGYSSGIGYTHVNRQTSSSPNYSRLAYVDLGFPEAKITSVELIADRAAGANMLPNPAFFVNYDGSTNINAWGTNVSVKREHAATVTAISVGSQADAKPNLGSLTGSTTLKKLIITGIGPNPFGASNC